MKTLLKARTILGVTLLLALALLVSGLSFTNAFAQGPTQGGNPPIVVQNNQAVLDLLKSSENDLYQLRLSGKSWLDIATSKGATDAALLDALLKPVNDRHAWMLQVFPQFNATQMTEWMRAQFSSDIRVSQFGTMTDRHVFGGVGMMGNWNYNGFGGMMRGGGMMGNWNNNGFGGMMRGGGMGNWNYNGYGGMMRGWNGVPNAAPGPAN